MSAHVDPWLACDTEGCDGQYPEDTGVFEFTDADLRELRTAAKADGWRCNRDGNDFCEDHASSPEALAGLKGSHRRSKSAPTWRM
jgi:hypothetical protein